MDKILHRIVLVVVILSTLVGITSCLPEPDPVNPFTLAVWTIHKAEDKQLYFIADDESTTFIPRTTLTYPDSLLNRRCYVEFIFSSEKSEVYTHVIDVKYVQTVSTNSLFDIKTQNHSDSLGNDPAEITLAWVSGNYLNLMYRYYGTGTVKHSFTVARNFFQPVVTPDSIVPIEFRHHMKGDNAGKEYLNIVSYDISDLAKDRTKDFYIKLKYRTFNLYFNTATLKVPIADIKQSAPFYLTRSTNFSLLNWRE